MDNSMYLVQRIESCCCERLKIENLYFGPSQDKGFDIYQKEIDTFISERYDDCTEEEKQRRICNDIDETKTYWEYCNDDGDNIVIMIEELKVPALASNK